MIVALLGLSLIASPRAAPNMVQPGPDLYPPAALAAKLEGNVIAHLQIGADGSIRCTAEAADRLASLKRPSCELIVRRDIFPPKVGSGGILLATSLDIIVRWKLATDNAQFGGAVPVGRDYWIRHADFPAVMANRYNGGKVRVGFDITATGRIENCMVERFSGVDAFDSAVCPLLLRRAALLPALDVAGVPRRTHGWFAVFWHDWPMQEDFSQEDVKAPGGLIE